MSKGKVLVAMSGGVDSSAAAYLLQQQGYECTGATMRLYDNEDAGLAPGTCCSLDDVEDARNVCFQLGIRHYVFNFTDTFRKEVMDRFACQYQAGLTPNPCIDCNRYLKFERLLQRALELGYDYLATGHYACIQRDDTGAHLLAGLDATKDQSYVLYSLTQHQLAHLLLPLGGLTKDEVRRIAAEAGLQTATKSESQDICFVPDGDYVEFLQHYAGLQVAKGDLLDLEGNVVGQHLGAIRYTIGQRKGLDVAFGSPRYVCTKNMTANTVTIGTKEDLAVNKVEVEDFNWITRPSKEPFVAQAKIRYRQQSKACKVICDAHDTNNVTLEFAEPEYGVAPGQAAVVYDGAEVLGGGTILRAFA